MKNILKKEFTTAPSDSFNGILSELIQKTRYYRESVTIEEFKRNIPSLHLLEDKLNSMNEEIGEDEINYLEIIMDALSQEQDIEDELVEEMKSTIRDIIKYRWELEVEEDLIEISPQKFRSTYLVEVNLSELRLEPVQEEYLLSICKQIAVFHKYLLMEDAM